MKKTICGALLIIVAFLLGCAESKNHTTGVYMLIDTSGTYTKEIDKARSILNYTLATLNPGDSISVARIDSGSFSEKDIITKATLDRRPSISTKQKLAFMERFNTFSTNARGSSYTDITGGILQAIEFLNEADTGRKFVILFTDLEEDLKKGHKRDLDLPLAGFEVIAVNVTKLSKDNIDPQLYLNRLEQWRKKVETGGGSWKVVNDIERIERIFGS